MSELSRRRKIDTLLSKQDWTIGALAFKTDQEINDLYNEHFNKVTLEDFEGFKKVCERFGFGWCDTGAFYGVRKSIDEIKKELGL